MLQFFQNTLILFQHKNNWGTDVRQLTNHLLGGGSVDLAGALVVQYRHLRLALLAEFGLDLPLLVGELPLWAADCDFGLLLLDGWAEHAVAVDSVANDGLRLRQWLH